MTLPLNPYTAGTEEHAVWEHQEMMSGVELHRGQLRMAERLARQFGDRLRYAHGLSWFFWTGKRWQRDLTGFAQQCAVDTLKTAYRSLPDIPGQQERRELIEDIRKCEKATGIEGMLKLAGAIRGIAITPSQLDADPWLFNVDNGTLDLRTEELRPHDPADLISKVAGCVYNPYLLGPQFDSFIAEILPDEETRSYVQRLFGSSMFGGIRDHVLPIFTGTGSNGKSTLVELVRDVFGDYAIAAEPELLVDNGSAHPTGQADLLGVRLATTMETDEGKKLAPATVKRLTGGDRIRARRMRQDFFEFNPSHTIIMVTNKLPEIRGDDPAIWRRLQVVPFEIVVPPEDIDLALPDKLALERAYVLSWVFAGYRSWNADGLAPPPAVQASTQRYRSDSDSVGRFVVDQCLRSMSATTYLAELWNAYRKWCDAGNERPGTEKEFANALRSHGFTTVRRTRGMAVEGLMLLSDSEEPESEEPPDDRYR